MAAGLMCLAFGSAESLPVVPCSRYLPSILEVLENKQISVFDKLQELS
jgi:hypothetical protein